MEEIWHILLSALVTFLFVVSEVLGTVNEFESKSISVLTSSLMKSTGEAVIASFREPSGVRTLRVVKISHPTNV